MPLLGTSEAAVHCAFCRETCILKILQLPGFLVPEAWHLHGRPLAVQGENLRRPAPELHGCWSCQGKPRGR